MKESPLANCERDFILQVIERNKRSDGRRPYDYRNIKISFGTDYGCCHVEIGNTKVMAQVTSSIVEPKQTRPNEGVLMINIEFNHVACPGFEPGRLSRKGVQINRLLERCIKECKCVDLESLCVIAEKQVWEVRADVKVLNHDGNILDACSLAAITALAHFKRPDVSVEDGKITIHPPDEKTYIPLSVHHMPICTSFSFFHSGNCMLLDACYDEERVMEGQMIIAMNKHREICALHMSGSNLRRDKIPRCTNIAAAKVSTHTELLQRALQNDKESRDKGEGPGCAELNVHSKVDKLSKKMEKGINFRADTEKVMSSDEYGGGDSAQEVDGDSDEMGQDEEEVKQPSDEQWRAETAKANFDKDDEPIVEIGSGGLSSWNAELQIETNETGLSEQTQILARKRKRRGKKNKAKKAQSDSEEEEIVVLQAPA